MTLHVKQGFDPKVLTHRGALCGIAQPYVKAGYNAQWDLVYDLQTGQAVRFQDVCSSCLRVIQVHKQHNKRRRIP